MGRLFDKLRQVLLEAGDEGLTTRALAEKTSSDRAAVYVALTKMPEVYIDRWQLTENGRAWAQVWVIVRVPEDCPRPEKSPAFYKRNSNG